MLFHVFVCVFHRRISRTAVLVFGANAAARSDGVAEMRCDRQSAAPVYVDVGRIPGKNIRMQTLLPMCYSTHLPCILPHNRCVQIPDNSRFLVGQYVTIHDDVISHVNISNVKEEDGGEYMCTAQNTIGR